MLADGRLLFGGHTLIPHKPSTSKDDLSKSFWENIHFGRVVVWYVAHDDDHIFFQSIHCAK